MHVYLRETDSLMSKKYKAKEDLFTSLQLQCALAVLEI